MADYCVICETEAVDSTDWFYDSKKCEHICPWCIQDMRLTVATEEFVKEYKRKVF